MKNVTIGSAVGMIRRRSCADSGGPARVPSPVKVVRLVLCVAAHVGLKVTATHSASWCHCGCGACTMAGCGHCTWQNKELFLKGKLQAAVQLGSVSTRLLFVVGCLGLVFNASLITCRKFAWPYLGKATAAAHSYQCVQQFCVSKPWCGCQCLGFLTCAQMLMHATAHGGCMNIVRESVLKANLEWKIPYHIGRLNPWQYCTWLFSPMLYQLNYPAPAPRTLFSHPFLGHDSQKNWGDWGILHSGHWCTKLCTHLYMLHGPGGCHQQPCHLLSHCPQRLPAPSVDHHQKTSTQMLLCITENSRHVDVFLSSAHVRLGEILSAIFITKILPVKCLIKHVCVH